ncbi:MAG TPA: GTP 3',8-cyclase MoaA [Burkholderiales bacterium]|jgi:cyclic pyranopterin phosphate synthase|nr:GTP 3',8-cyclase MoaA [Burkholderiales bacterium]
MDTTNLLQDTYHRQFKYIRLSLTDKCNFRCQYCLPNGYISTNYNSSLSTNEINNLVAAVVELGVSKIRLTGGEPSLRNDLGSIIKIIKQFPQIETIALTTNAYKLQTQLDDYIHAGLTNLNISVDSLDPEHFKQITATNKLNYVLESLDYALQSSIKKVKINTVLLKSNFGELTNFLNLLRQQNLDVRFIELMRTNENQQYFADNYLPASQLIAELNARGWRNSTSGQNDGPAKMFAHPGYLGKIGVIAPYSKDFCTGCNRLRFTHLGALKLCLFGEQSYNLRDLMQNSTQKAQLKQTIIKLLTEKPKEHLLQQNKSGDVINFSKIGG